MAVSQAFIDNVKQQLSADLPVSIRPLFGEALVCCDDTLVGLITDDVLYIKADSSCREAFDRLGLVQMENNPVSCDGLIYYEISESVFSDSETLMHVIQTAVDVARRSKSLSRQQELAL
ncbi:MAG: TfoX/Sxy family protein [Cellvibrionaceae bacterium]